MSAEDSEELDSTNQPSGEDVNTEDVEETSAEGETEDNQPEYTEHEKKSYERARLAEAKLKEARAELARLKQSPKEPPTPSGTGSLTTTVKELKAISDLEDDDAEYVATYAEKFGVSLSEARKNKDVQAVLKVRAEERRTAEATSTGPARRGSSKVSDEKLLEQAASWNIPDDEDAMKRIASSRLKKKGS